mmetsp:Transcript_833/g.1467  ORF Transcript_833/g.1467 Transcript_833/m.1467 type:complete len:367 (+) Transcript_833:426-1526(+)
MEVINQLLPQYKGILKDQDTITQYGLKLLNTLVEIDPRLVVSLTKYGITSHLMEYFQTKHLHNGLHSVKLIASIARSSTPPDYTVLRVLCQHSLIPTVCVLLRHWYKESKEWFFQPLLEIIHCVLLAATGRKEDQQGNVASVSVSPQAQKPLLEATEGLSETVNLIMELCIVGTRSVKTSVRKPALVQIGFNSINPSRQRTGAGGESSLNSSMSAEVRLLATSVLKMLVELYPGVQASILSQANIARFGAGLAYSTRRVAYARSKGFAGPANFHDGRVQSNLLDVMWQSICTDSKKEQALAAYCMKTPSLIRIIQDVAQKSSKAADVSAQKRAGAVVGLLLKRMRGGGATGSGPGSARRVSRGSSR